MRILCGLTMENRQTPDAMQATGWTDYDVGHDGFIGVKTGSDSAALG
jgi:hypothetical protein